MQVCVLPLVSCPLFWPHRQCHPDFRPFLTIPLFVPLWWQRFLLPRIAPTPLSWNKRNTTDPNWHPTGMNLWYCSGALPLGKTFTWNPWKHKIHFLIIYDMREKTHKKKCFAETQICTLLMVNNHQNHHHQRENQRRTQLPLQKLALRPVRVFICIASDREWKSRSQEKMLL